ncbi:MAG: DUF11 domain-containing protein [Caldilineaceae bacterium]|nr:DUF11 domain-containing protein [Caldilineaceae bacterium]HRJ43122.1 PKD domain-containing protein [Caldilineaceae bacterium]
MTAFGNAQAGPGVDVGPDLAVAKFTEWPYEPQAAPGDLIAFSLRVENLGPGNGQNVLVTDTLPAFLTYEASQNNLCDGPCPVTIDGQQIVWQLGNLPAETLYAYITLWARVSSTVTVGALLTNTVEIGGASGEIDANPLDEVTDPYANNRSSLEVTIIPHTPDLQIYNALAGGVAAPGEKVRYRILLINQGAALAEDVILTDTLPLSVTYLAHSSYFPVNDPQTFTPTVNGPNVVWYLGDLPRDAWGYFFVDVQIDSQLAVGESLFNQSLVSSSSVELDRYPNQFTSQFSLVSNVPNLWVDKFSDGPRTPGSQFRYIIRLSNNGGGSATGVRITDTLPAELRFVSATSQSCLDPLAPEICQTNTFTQTVNGQQVVWAVGSVPPGVQENRIEALVELSNSLVPGALITNVVTIRGNEVDANPGDDIFISTLPVVEVSEPDAAIFKSVTSSPPRPGGSIDYRLRVVNQGAFRLTNVILTDTLPAGVSLDQSFHTTCFAPPACLDNQFAPVIESGQLRWQVDEIAVGGYGDFYLTVDVPLTLTEGSVLTNTARISADNPETDLSDNQSQTVVTVVGVPQLAIQKTGPGIALWKHPITYTLTVSNSGDGRAIGLVITDALPVGSVYWSGGSFASGVISWTQPVLAAGADIQVSFVVSAEGTIRNSLYGVTAAGGVSAQGSESVTTTVVQLSASNSSPTRIGQATYFTATLTPDLPAWYLWDFGDGVLSGPIRPPTTVHTYTKYQEYTATITTSSNLGTLTATTPILIEPYRLYLPLNRK